MSEAIANWEDYSPTRLDWRIQKTMTAPDDTAWVMSRWLKRRSGSH